LSSFMPRGRKLKWRSRPRRLFTTSCAVDSISPFGEDPRTQALGPVSSGVSFLPEGDTLIVSPTLFERGLLHQPDDIASHVLLGSETRPGDWANWLERAGLPHRSEQRRRVFDHFFVTLQAVVDGLGAGIGPFPILQTDVAVGCLLTPFSTIQVPRTGYVALVPFDASKTSTLTSFVDWLVAEGSPTDVGSALTSRH
jgi:LysR family transcriptional regulator, glycine cleavage system transcriptional activator